MAKKVTELPVASALDGTEAIPVVQGGISKQTTTQEIASLGGGGDLTMADWDFPLGAFPTTAKVLYIATADHGTPVDADYVPQGTWFIAKSTSPTPSAYADFNYK